MTNLTMPTAVIRAEEIGREHLGRLVSVTVPLSISDETEARVSGVLLAITHSAGRVTVTLQDPLGGSEPYVLSPDSQVRVA